MPMSSSKAFELAVAQNLDPHKSGSVWRLVCPSCNHGHERRHRHKRACVLFSNGHWMCHRCGERGWIDALDRQAPTLRAAIQPTQTKPNQKHAERLPLDLAHCADKLHELRERFRESLRSWAIRRGWPVQIAGQLVTLEDVLWASEGTGDAELERLRQDTLIQGHKYSLLVLHRDEQGRPRSYTRRWNQIGARPERKALYASARFVSYRGLRVLGHLPKAITRLRLGQPLYIVEGEPDFMVASCMCAIRGRGAVLGATGCAALPDLARAIRKALWGSGTASCGPIVLVPHIGDRNNIGERFAQDAAEVLRGCANIHLARVAQDKGDLADVLEQHGLDCAYQRLDEAPLLYRGLQSIDQARAELACALPNILATPGTHAVCASTGTGKTYSMVRAVVDLALRTVQARQDAPLDTDHDALHGTRDALHQWLSHAKDKNLVTIEVCLPTKRLRDEVFHAFQEQLKAHQGLAASKIRLTTRRSTDDPPPKAPQSTFTKPQETWCEHPDLFLAASHALGAPTQVACKGCKLFQGSPLKATCGFWRQHQASAAPWTGVEIRLTTHAMSQKASKPEEDGPQGFVPDLRIVDETPLDAWYQTRELAISQLVNAIASEELRCDDANALEWLRSIADNACHEDLRERIGALHLELGPSQSTAKRYLRAANEQPSKREQALALQKAPAWDLWPHLIELVQRGWWGAYVQNQRLHFVHRAAPAPAAFSTVYLDATSTKALAQTLLPGCVWHDFTIPLPPQAKITQVLGSFSKRDVLRDRHGTHARWLATHKLHDCKDTLHITHKALVELLRPHVQGSVTYYGASDATGSNVHEQSKRAVADPWFVPKRPVQALTQALAQTHTDDLELHHQAALDHMRARQVHQALGRIRPYSGKSCELVLLGEDWPGLHPHQQTLPPAPEDHKPRRSTNLWATQVAEQVERWGGCWSPALQKPSEADGDDMGTAWLTSGQVTMAGGKPCCSAPSKPPTRQALEQALDKHFGGSWQELAMEAGLYFLALPSARGGQPIPVLSNRPILRADVERLASKLHLDYIRFHGEKITFRKASKLEEALAMAHERMRAAPGLTLTTKLLGEMASVTDRAIRKWINAAGFEVEQYLNAHAQPPALEPVEVEVLEVEEAKADAPRPPPQPRMGGGGRARRWDVVGWTLGAEPQAVLGWRAAPDDPPDRA